MTNKIPESNSSILVRRVETYQVDKRCENLARDGSLNRCEGVMLYKGLLFRIGDEYPHRCNICYREIELDKIYPYNVKKLVDFEDER